MSKVRLILVTLICASPAILLWDGLIMQGLVAGIVAVALVITARTLRPGETSFSFPLFARWRWLRRFRRCGCWFRYFR